MFCTVADRNSFGRDGEEDTGATGGAVGGADIQPLKLNDDNEFPPMTHKTD